MFSYIIPVIALLLLFSNPILQLFQPDRPLATERPAINESLLAIPGEGDGVGCEGGYKVHVWSVEPLVVYVEGFLSEGERAELSEMRYVLLCRLSHMAPRSFLRGGFETSYIRYSSLILLSHLGRSSPRAGPLTRPKANTKKRAPIRALDGNKQRRDNPPQPHGPRLPRGPHPAHAHHALRRGARPRPPGVARGRLGREAEDAEVRPRGPLRAPL